VVWLVPDLEVQTIKIYITMKKEQNLQEPHKQALNIPDVRQRTFIDKFFEWIYCRKYGHEVSHVHPLYPSKYCSMCNKHRSQF
jgi:hypothetical protein